MRAENEVCGWKGTIRRAPSRKRRSGHPRCITSNGSQVVVAEAPKRRQWPADWPTGEAGPIAAHAAHKVRQAG